MEFLKIVGQSHCFLCWLPFESDQKIRAVVSRGAHRISISDSHATIKDRSFCAQICFSEKCFSCPDFSGEAFPIHEDCFMLLLGPGGKGILLDATLWQLGRSLSPLFFLNNRSKEKIARIQFRASFASEDFLTLGQDLETEILELPPELRFRIFDDVEPCPYQCPAIILTESKKLVYCLGDASLGLKDRLTTFNLSDNLEYKYIRIFGIDYISGFHRKPSTRNENRIMKPVVCQGDFGIVDVQFLGNGQCGQPRKGAHWYSIYRQGTDSFDIKLKPLLVEDVTPRSLSPASSTWDTPNPPETTMNRIEGSIRPESRKEVRIRYVALAKPIVGMTVCCRLGSTVGLHAHSSYTASIHADLFPEEGLSELVYVFLPIAKNERISHIWVRNTTQGSPRRPILSTRMSTGKYYTLGPYVPPGFRSGYSFHPLQGRHDGDVLALCYNELGTASSLKDLVVAASCTASAEERVFSNPPWPSELIGPTGAPGYEWYFLEARLANISSLHTCIDDSHAHNPVVGALIKYHDGTVAALGQWRVDKGESSSTYTTESTGLLRWTEGIFQGRRYVKELLYSGSRSRDDKEVHCIPLDGKLLWWFSPSGSELYHQAS